MKKINITYLFLILLIQIFLYGCSQKAADITDIDYVQHHIKTSFSQKGYEVQNIRVRGPMSAQKKVNAEGKLIQLFTIQGCYDAYFQYRLKGSNDEWGNDEKHFIVTYNRGKWSCKEVDNNK